MTPEKLKKSQTDFKAIIREKANELLRRENPNNEEGVIYDGVGNFVEYLKTPKIMWILKESTNEDENDEDGGKNSYDISEYNFIDGDQIHPSTRKMTFVMEAYKTPCEYEDVPPLGKLVNKDNAIRMKKALASTAYINTSKLLGDKSTTPQRLKQLYDQWEEVVWMQIEMYNPDIIIFGGTFEVFKADLKKKGTMSQIKKEETVRIYSWENKTLIDTYHPSYFKFNCSNIIDILKNK